ncbi:MAG: hypothetical protein Tsb002_37200 [Wenzhouxiangellaceae bacterium]
MKNIDTEKEELKKKVAKLESRNALLKKANRVARSQYTNRLVDTKLANNFGMFGIVMAAQVISVLFFENSIFEGSFAWIFVVFMFIYLVGFSIHMALLYKQRMKITAEWEETKAKIEASVGDVPQE